MLLLAERASAAVHAQGDPEALHTAALIDLLWSDGAGIPLGRSISYLRMVSRLADRPAPALADLAAAYLLRAEWTQMPRDLLEAIDVAQQALELEPRNEAALFNLALSMDRLGLQAQSAESWRIYLEIDSVSQWAGEARMHVRGAFESPPPRRLDDQVFEVEAFVARDPQAARLLGWDKTLGDWGTALLRDDTIRAQGSLRHADALGRALANRRGDATLSEAVRAIHASAGNKNATLALARAHHAYALGQSEYLAADFAAAGSSFEKAISPVHSSWPLRQWALLFLGSTLVYRGDILKGESTIRNVAATADSLRYPALAGRARWSLGLTVLRRGRHQEGLMRIKEAERLFERIGELEHLGALQAVEAEAQFDVGDGPTAFVSMHRALTTLRAHGRSVWLHNALWVAARAAGADGLQRAALRIQAEGVTVAGRTGHPIDLIEARLARARLLEADGGHAAAGRDLDLARREIGKLAHGEARRWFEADLRLSEAAVSRRDRPAKAAAALDSVITFFEGFRNPVRLLPALRVRAEALLALGDIGAATADLDRAVDLLEVRRASITSATERASLLEAGRGIFDKIVMLRLADGRPGEALEYLELGRAWLAPVGGASRKRMERRLAAPSSEVAVDYALVGDTLLVWTIADTSIRLTRMTLDRNEFFRTMERARASLELRVEESAARPHLARLYDLLVRPVEAQLGGAEKPLVIIADGDVGGVPFAALYDTLRRRYLIEDHALRFVTSLHDASSKPAKRSARAAALLVADPAFDYRAFPNLARLAGASAEVAAIGKEYVDPVVISGADANRVSLEKALLKASVMHYAGHAVYDNARPEQSQLVLANGDAGMVGRLTATEISRLDLRHVQLVVLSACQTSDTRSQRSGGFVGLTGAFLSAGVTGVVGSLWRVDDDFTRELMVEFHRAYQVSPDGATALRAAQLRLLRSSHFTHRSPAAWAGFRFTGN